MDPDETMGETEEEVTIDKAVNNIGASSTAAPSISTWMKFTGDTNMIKSRNDRDKYCPLTGAATHTSVMEYVVMNKKIRRYTAASRAAPSLSLGTEIVANNILKATNDHVEYFPTKRAQQENQLVDSFNFRSSPVTSIRIIDRPPCNTIAGYCNILLLQNIVLQGRDRCNS
jgi:hypothetical protein